jgi:hypothetical protein
MKNCKSAFGMLALALAFSLVLAGCEDATKETPAPATFVAVTGITGVPTGATVETDLALSGTAAPANATNKTIVWSIQSAGSAGASIVDGNKLHTTTAGTATVRATVVGGASETSNYTEAFTVAVSAAGAFVPVTDITGVPSATTAWIDLALLGTVAPSNATNQAIVWSVESAGDTNAAIVSETTLRTSAAGTATVKATITDGLTATSNYTQVFTVAVSAGGAFVPVTDITGVPNRTVAGIDLPLSGTVEPGNATNQAIAWSVVNAGTTEAIIVDGTKLNTTAAGTAIVRATIAGGRTTTSNYIDDFLVTVDAAPDTRPTLTAGPAVDAEATANKAVVTFGDATTGLTLSSSDFTVDNNGVVTEASVSGNTARVTVVFAPNVDVTPKTFIVSIAPGSGKIKGNATVTITQAGATTPPLTTATIDNQAALRAFIAAYCLGGTADAPKNIKFSGAITGSDLTTVRGAVNNAETYVAWDLSAITGDLSAAQIGDTIDADTDAGRDKIKGLILPASLTAIGASAFYGCSGLDSVFLPAGLGTIGDSAFYGCTGLTSVALPSTGLETIGASAFYGCTSLDGIALPASLKTIGTHAFSGCASLSFTANGGTWTTDASGKALIKDGNTLVSYPSASGAVDVSSATGLTTIGYEAFYGCTYLTGITLPSGLKTIGDYAFFGCSGLDSVSLPAGLETVGASAFESCTSLTGITLPSSLKTIGGYAFLGCYKLASVTFTTGSAIATQWNSYAFPSGSGDSLWTAYTTGKAGTYTRSGSTWTKTQ